MKGLDHSIDPTRKVGEDDREGSGNRDDVLGSHREI